MAAIRVSLYTETFTITSASLDLPNSKAYTQSSAFFLKDQVLSAFTSLSN